MAILNFNKKFVEAVINGTKTQTIRAFRKFPIQPGEKLFLYTGLRAKRDKDGNSQTFKLRDAYCRATKKIMIDTDGISIDGALWISGSAALDEFSKQDGFEDWQDMLGWWEGIHGLPFEGTLIFW